jgi:hypothetical protein
MNKKAKEQKKRIVIHFFGVGTDWNAKRTRESEISKFQLTILKTCEKIHPKEQKWFCGKEEWESNEIDEQILRL